MSKSLAIMSGKGGSGKTTLALSISTMLSNCGIKVLMIDCDIYTNGATYFYEDKLNEVEENGTPLTSFYEILIDNRIMPQLNFVRINEFFDFVPSITQVTNHLNNNYINDHPYCQIGWFISLIKDKYDIIIFDCQAGYTNLLERILPHINISLFVMEGDAISASAIRSLYLKIGDLINDKKVYQVFNKATQEEYDIYSQLSGGTVFTNIETVMFDWKIRKAFSVSQIPDMENTSANYGTQIYKICNVLFPYETIKTKLEPFEAIICLNQKKEEEVIITKKIQDLETRNKSNQSRFIKFITSLFVPLITCVFLFVFATITLNKTFSNNNGWEFIILIALIVVFLLLFMVFVLDFLKDGKKGRQILYENLDQLHQIRKDIKLLEHNLSQKNDIQQEL